MLILKYKLLASLGSRISHRWPSGINAAAWSATHEYLFQEGGEKSYTSLLPNNGLATLDTEVESMHVYSMRIDHTSQTIF